MTRPLIDSAAKGGVANRRNGRKTVGGLAMALALILMTPGGAALAAQNTELWNQDTLLLDGDTTFNDPNLFIGNTSNNQTTPNKVTINTRTYTGTINSVISEDPSVDANGTQLVKDGTGTLVLHGVNTYKGGTVVNAGTVAINDDSSLGAAGAALTLNDQTTLRLDANNIIIDQRPVNLVSGAATADTQGYTGTISGVVSGSGGLNKTGGGILQLYGTNTYTGGTRVSEGTLAINAGSALGGADSRLTMDGGTTLRLDAASVDLGQRPMTINGGMVTINTQGNTGTFGGVIDGTAKLVLDASTADNGNSVVELYGNNTYSGGTQVKNGTVAIKGADAFGTGKDVELWNRTTLRLDEAATISNQNLIIGNTGNGTGSPYQVTVNTNGFDGTINSAVSEAVAGTGLVKTGGGVLALYGDNTYSGGTTLNQGTIAIKADNGLGATHGRLTMGGGTTLRLDGNVTSASRPIILTSGQGTIDTQGNTGNFGGLVSGAGQLVKTGGGVLELYYQSNAYTGGTVVAAGTLAITSAGALGANDALALELQNQTTLRLDANVNLGVNKVVTLSGASATIDTQTNTGKLEGTIIGTGQLIKRGNGSLELANTGNTYAGGTWIQQGRVIIFNDAALGAADGALKMDDQTTLQLNADVDSARAVNLTGGQATLDTRGYTNKFSGVISGAGGLIIDDQSGASPSTSRIELTGNNSYAGGTTVRKGTLGINNDNALGGEAGALTLNDKTTLELMADITNNTRLINLNSGTATIDTLANTGTFGGTFGGTGGLDKTGGGTLALLGSNTYAGNTRIKKGTLAINSNASLGQGTRLELWNKTTLELLGNTLLDTSRQVVIGDNSAPDSATPGNATIPNSVTINTGIYTGQFDGNITQAADSLIDTAGGVRLDKTGSGVLALYGENGHKGGTWVKQGTLAIKSQAGLGQGALYLGYHGNTTHHGGETGIQADSIGTLRFDGDLGGSGFYTNVFLNSGGGVIDTQDHAVLFNGNTLQDGNDDGLFASPPYTRAQGSYQVGDGAGALTKKGAGVMGIDGFQYYRGATNVDEGTLRIYSRDSVNEDNREIGVVNTSAVNIAAGARLEGQGVIGNDLNQKIKDNTTGTPMVDAPRLDIVGVNGVTKTLFTNSGTIAPGLEQYLRNVGDPLIDVTRFNALTLAGNYTANPGAVVEINTQLFDGTSHHGTLVITGVVEDSAAVTGVKVNHRGGAGTLTDEGIEIIRILGTDKHVDQGNKFRLISDFTTKDGQAAIVGGAYAYWLEDDYARDYETGQEDRNYSGIFLRNAKKSDGTRIVNPSTPIYESYAMILGNLNRLPTLEQRVGHRNWQNSTMAPEGDEAYPMSAGDRAVENRGAWVRLEGGTGTWKPDLATDGRGEQSKYDLDYASVNIGLDWPLHQFENGSKLIGGLNVNLGLGKAEIKSPNGDGRIDTDYKGVGGTLTWYSDDGFYADAQARYNWFTSDISSHVIKSAGNQVSSNDGQGQAYSLELGRIFKVDDKWSLTPQAQLTYSRTSFDSFTDAQSTKVVNEEDYKSLESRLGLALNYENSYEASQGMVSRNKLYGLVNYYHEFKGDSTISVNTVEYKSESSANWIGLGVGGSHNWRNDQFSVYGELGVRSSTDHFGNEREFTGKLGFRVAF